MKKNHAHYILPYLPDLLINSLTDKSLKLDRCINGSLLFADLSGFTAMSEKLASLGRIGAEKLANIMNDCFDSLLAIVYGSGGDVIKFGGDAFLALFTGPDNARRAFDAGCDLINWIAANGNITTPAGEFSLGIHAGISQGDIFNLCIGDKRREHLFCGLTVENAYGAADAAGLGQLAITNDVRRSIADLDYRKSEDGFFILEPPNRIPNFKPAQRPVNAVQPEDNSLEKFIIPSLIDQLFYNNGQIEGEHRILTSLFIGVCSLRKNLELDLDNSIPVINEYFSVIHNIITSCGGSFARLDSSGSAEKVLVFFGAPLSTGRDTYNCLKAVLEIKSALKELNKKFKLPVSHRYGINTGLCFVGDVGGKLRKEYTAMGDAVNLAARLMSKASYDEALVSEDTMKIVRDSFLARSGGSINVKGKKEPVQIYYLDRLNEKDNAAELLIGREKELQQARSFVENVKISKRKLMVISGEPGAGKSLLCAKIKTIANQAGLTTVEGACFRHSEKTPYEPLKAILEGLMGLTQNSAIKDRKKILQKYLRLGDEQEWGPLIAPLIDYYPSIPPHLKNLPEDTKRKKINDILCRLICEINRRKPTLLIIEDVQWIDNASFNIIKLLIGQEETPGLVFVSRPGKKYDELKDIEGSVIIELGPLAPENSRILFTTILKDVKPDEDIINQVIEKSGGNPFYLEEMAKAFRELGSEKFAAGENIPLGIESVITARIDNLGEMLKKTIRTASVIGRAFAFNLLKAVFPDRKRASMLKQYLQELAHLDLTPLERSQPVLEYIFKHILTQEVAYNGLSFSARKNLHLKIAEQLSRQKKILKHHPEMPARHFLMAEEDEKAMPYLFMAGQKAAAEFANNEAFEFYARVIDIAGRLDKKDYLIQAFRNRGELAKRTGDYKLAEQDFRQLRQLSENDITATAMALSSLSEVYRLTAEYDKTEKIIDDLEKLRPDDIYTRVFCLNSRGDVTRRRGNLQQGNELLLEALNLSLKHDIPSDLKAIIYNNLGICHWSLGKLKEATEFYKSALILYRRLKDLSGQSKITNNLGILSDEMGKLNQAAKAYEKAEKIFKRIGATRSLAFACANLGTNLTIRGYLSQAEAKLFQAKSIFEKIGDQHSLAYAIGDIGFVHLCTGNLEKASHYFADALEMANNIKDKEFILESSLRIARINLIRKKLSSDDIERLVEMAKEVGSKELEIRAIILQATLCLERGDRNELKNNLETLKNISEIEDYTEFVIEYEKLHVVYQYLMDNDNKALKLLKSAFKKAFAGDQAIYAIDLWTLAEGCGLNDKISERHLAKIKEYHRRILDNISENDSALFVANHKRKIEVFKQTAGLKFKPEKKSKILEPTHN
jgi:class 3 adenylate cyclase/tetratricopeptide (TPR) repeat protein